MRSRLLATLFLAACTRTETVTRFVNLHVTGGPACRIADNSFGKYIATGDFEPLANVSQQPLETDVAGQTIDGVPGNVKSLALLANQQAEPSLWFGATLVPDTGDVDMLLLPSSSSCALTGSTVPFDAHMTFVAVSPHTLITTGTTSGTHSFRMNLDTGRIAQMTIGIGQPRTNAATVALGDGRAFVIGGVSSGAVLGSVEIYDEAASDFEVTKFFLVEARSDHGAAVLGNGDVLVAGGHSGKAILATERLTFDGTQWRATESTLPLDTEHLDPFVLRLADGTVLVGGGVDDGGSGVGEVEFYSADGNKKLAPTPVPASPLHAFVALDGGGALFVDSVASPNTYFVSPNNTYPVCTIAGPFTDVKLFAHDKGGALIWTGSAWWMFDPWSGCAPLPNAPSTGPSPTSPVVFSEAGMRAWITPDGSGKNGTVSVWRDSVRNAFATDSPFLVSDTQLIAPDALPAPTFGASGLPLSSTQAAFVADARYLDVAVQVDGAHVVIRAPSGEVDVGRDCAIQPSETLYVERHGPTVAYAQGGGPLIPCATIDPTARVAVGVRGSGVAHDLVVKRLGAALP